MNEQFWVRAGQSPSEQTNVFESSLYLSSPIFSGDSLLAKSGVSLKKNEASASSSDLKLAEGRMLTDDGSNCFKYKVKRGDTLWDLASEIVRTITGKHAEGSRVHEILLEIARASKLLTAGQRDRISLGQEISVPRSFFAKLEGVIATKSGVDTKADTPRGVDTSPDTSGVTNTKSDIANGTNIGSGTAHSTADNTKASNKAKGSGPVKDSEHAECAHSDESVLVPEIVKAVATNEGSSFKSVNWNDNGAGISVGVLQWNQERGALPTLIRGWNRQNPSAFREIFQGVAPNGKRYSENLLNEHWLRNYNIAGDPALKSAMIRALANPGFQQVQLRLAKEAVSDHVDMAHKFNVKTNFGVAVVADIANQVGPVRTEGMLRKFANKFDSESEMVSHLVRSTRWRPHARNRIDNIERKFVAFAGVGSHPY